MFEGGRLHQLANSVYPLYVTCIHDHLDTINVQIAVIFLFGTCSEKIHNQTVVKILLHCVLRLLSVITKLDS